MAFDFASIYKYVNIKIYRIWYISLHTTKECQRLPKQSEYWVRGKKVLKQKIP